MISQKTKHINVTHLTANQRRKLFMEHMNQSGFTGFIKHERANQTIYEFTYLQQPITKPEEAEKV